MVFKGLFSRKNSEGKGTTETPAHTAIPDKDEKQDRPDHDKKQDKQDKQGKKDKKKAKPIKDKPISKSLIKTWSQPLLAPGVYGAFPLRFVVRFTTPRESRLATNLCLGVDCGGAFIPLNAIIFDFQTWRHVTLLSSPDAASPPLSYMGDEKLLGLGIIVALPAAAESDANHVRRMYVVPGDEGNFFFRAPVGPDMVEEEFEWRNSYHDGDAVKRIPLFRRLVRLATSTDEHEDVVFEYATEKWWEDMYEGRTAASFSFRGAGMTGELGPLFTLLAVTSILKILAMEWYQKVYARLIVQGTKKVVGGVASTARVGVKITMVGLSIAVATNAI